MLNEQQDRTVLLDDLPFPTECSCGLSFHGAASGNIHISWLLTWWFPGRQTWIPLMVWIAQSFYALLDIGLLNSALTGCVPAFASHCLFRCSGSWWCPWPSAVCVCVWYFGARCLWEEGVRGLWMMGLIFSTKSTGTMPQVCISWIERALILGVLRENVLALLP